LYVEPGRAVKKHGKDAGAAAESLYFIHQKACQLPHRRIVEDC